MSRDRNRRFDRRDERRESERADRESEAASYLQHKLHNVAPFSGPRSSVSHNNDARLVSAPSASGTSHGGQDHDRSSSISSQANQRSLTEIATTLKDQLILETRAYFRKENAKLDLDRAMFEYEQLVKQGHVNKFPVHADRAKARRDVAQSEYDRLCALYTQTDFSDSITVLAKRLSGSAELSKRIEGLERRIKAQESSKAEVHKSVPARSANFEQDILSRLHSMENTIHTQAKEITELKTSLGRQTANPVSQRYENEAIKAEYNGLKEHCDKQHAELKSTIDTMIRDMVSPFEDKIRGLTSRYNELPKLEIQISETTAMVKELRGVITIESPKAQVALKSLQDEIKRLESRYIQQARQAPVPRSPISTPPFKPMSSDMNIELKSIHAFQAQAIQDIEQVKTELEGLRLAQANSQDNIGQAFDGLASEFDQLKKSMDSVKDMQSKSEQIKTDVLEQSLRRDISNSLRGEIEGVNMGIRNLDHRFNALTTEHLAREILNHLHGMSPAGAHIAQLEARLAGLDQRLMEVSRVINNDNVSMAIHRAVTARAHHIEEEYKGFVNDKIMIQAHTTEEEYKQFVEAKLKEQAHETEEGYKKFLGLKLGYYLGTQDDASHEIASLKSRIGELEDTVHKVQMELASLPSTSTATSISGSTSQKRPSSMANGHASSVKRHKTSSNEGEGAR